MFQCSQTILCEIHAIVLLNEGGESYPTQVTPAS